MKVGFVGIGSQGGGIAEMIAHDHELHIWARRPEATKHLVEMGAVAEPDAAAAARDMDVFGICVVTDDDVLEVAIDKGVLAAMKPGATFVIHSTIRPSTCAKVAEAAKKYGVNVLDAPVSGSSEAALAKTLLVMVGGDETILNSVRPVFETFANPIIHLGPLGSGQVAKLVNNILIIANMNLAQEALAFGEKLGMDRAALRSLLLSGSGRSFALESLDRLVMPENAEHVYRLFEKDITLAEELAKENSLSLEPLRSEALATLDFLKRIADST